MRCAGSRTRMRWIRSLHSGDRGTSGGKSKLPCTICCKQRAARRGIRGVGARVGRVKKAAGNPSPAHTEWQVHNRRLGKCEQAHGNGQQVAQQPQRAQRTRMMRCGLSGSNASCVGRGLGGKSRGFPTCTAAHWGPGPPGGLQPAWAPAKQPSTQTTKRPPHLEGVAALQHSVQRHAAGPHIRQCAVKLGAAGAESAAGGRRKAGWEQSTSRAAGLPQASSAGRRHSCGAQALHAGAGACPTQPKTDPLGSHRVSAAPTCKLVSTSGAT